MPLTVEEKPAEHLLIVHFSGKLTRGDYEQFVPVADRFIEANKPARVLMEMKDLESLEIGAAWEDFKFGMKHYSDLTRIALVGEKRWERFLAVICKPFTKAQTHAFAPAELAAAREWVLAG